MTSTLNVQNVQKHLIIILICGPPCLILGKDLMKDGGNLPIESHAFMSLWEWWSKNICLFSVYVYIMQWAKVLNLDRTPRIVCFMRFKRTQLNPNMCFEQNVVVHSEVKQMVWKSQHKLMSLVCSMSTYIERMQMCQARHGLLQQGHWFQPMAIKILLLHILPRKNRPFLCNVNTLHCA